MPLQPEHVKVVPLFGAVTDSATDDELASKAQRGDRSAFDRLVHRHQAAALNLAARYLGDASLARDAVQAAFLEMYRGLPKYEPRGRLVFWLRTIVLNQSRMLGRSTRIRERVTESYGYQPHAREEVTEGPEEWVAARQRRAALDAGLAALSEKLREVVVLRYVTGQTLEEIAEMLDIPLGTVKSRLFAGMAALKDRLGETS